MYHARGKWRDYLAKDLNNLVRHAGESLTEINKKLFKRALKCKKDLKY